MFADADVLCEQEKTPVGGGTEAVEGSLDACLLAWFACVAGHVASLMDDLQDDDEESDGNTKTMQEDKCSKCDCLGEENEEEDRSRNEWIVSTSVCTEAEVNDKTGWRRITVERS